MRVLGIDYGQERTGLAISDEAGRLVFPLLTLTLAQFQNRAQLLDALAAIAHTKNAEAAVLGLPILENGADSLTTRQVRNVASRIQRRLKLPLYFMPELLSTAEAKANLLALGLRGKKLKAVLDQAAACRILETFLAQRQEEWLPI